jgi:hypothetical protein
MAHVQHFWPLSPGLDGKHKLDVAVNVEILQELG